MTEGRCGAADPETSDRGEEGPSGDPLPGRGRRARRCGPRMPFQPPHRFVVLPEARLDERDVRQRVVTPLGPSFQLLDQRHRLLPPARNRVGVAEGSDAQDRPSQEPDPFPNSAMASGYAFFCSKASPSHTWATPKPLSELERLASRLHGSIRLPGPDERDGAVVADDGRERIELGGALRLRDCLFVPAQTGQVKAVPVMRCRVFRVELDRAPVFPLRAREVPGKNFQGIGQHRVRLRQRVVDLESLQSGGLCFRKSLFGGKPGIQEQNRVAVRQARVGQRVRRVLLDRLLEVSNPFLEFLAGPLVPVVSASQVQAVGFRVLGGAPGQPFLLLAGQPLPKLSGDVFE